MDIKKNLQYSLFIVLIIASFLFYYKYFSEDIKKVEKNESENTVVEKNTEINLNSENKNVIENLKYISEDLLGNTYTVTAQSASLKEDKLNEVQLFEVNAKIARENQETIYIYSKTANYNKINNNTVFKKKVTVKYGNQIINSEILNLNFKDNLIEILENVNYVSEITKIKADKVEIDLSNKKLKNNYTLLWDMKSNEGYINIVAVMQKYFDQSISGNWSYNPENYDEGEIPLSIMAEDLLTTYKLGWKTSYYQNTYDSKKDVEEPVHPIGWKDDVPETKTIMEKKDEEECETCVI